MVQLAEDVPLRPALLGNLQLQQLNMWMGNAPEGVPSVPHQSLGAIVVHALSPPVCVCVVCVSLPSPLHVSVACVAPKDFEM